MKLFFSFLAFLFAAPFVQGQYYYNDIIATEQGNKQHTLLRASHIQSVSAKSFDNDNQLSEGVSVEQEILNNTGRIITTASSPSAGKSVSVNYYTNNHLNKTVDTGGYVSSTTLYSYDANNSILNITTNTNDTFMKSYSEEIHEWHYNGNTPAYMLRIKDKTDTTNIEFVTDEQGNIAEEHWKKKNTEIETYYYYYNDKHQITDIVRFNKKAKRLLPDFLFEYDDKGNLSQLTQIPENSGAYLTWQYTYGANGLKQKELCFDKQKQLIGHIEYEYK